jgi:hypothetical protein
MKEVTSTAGVYTGPVVRKDDEDKKMYRKFMIPSEVFRKFESGRNKFERWNKYLDLSQESQKAIYDYARKNPKKVVVLQDETTGAMRAIRRRSANNL